MAGLVGYGSSDESGDNQAHPPPTRQAEKRREKVAQSGARSSTASGAESAQGPVVPVGAPADGPVAGPSIRPSVEDGNGQGLSPYSAERALIMDLTMPPVPVFDIPDSPPGSPDPTMEQKFGQFAKLKAQGHHFNERLARSAAIKNPNLFNKLMSSFGIEGEQYATSLSKDVWDPDQFPEWAYKQELLRAQTVAHGQLKAAQRESGRVDFAPAANKDK